MPTVKACQQRCMKLGDVVAQAAVFLAGKHKNWEGLQCSGTLYKLAVAQVTP